MPDRRGESADAVYAGAVQAAEEAFVQLRRGWRRRGEVPCSRRVAGWAGWPGYVATASAGFCVAPWACASAGPCASAYFRRSTRNATAKAATRSAAPTVNASR